MIAFTCPGCSTAHSANEAFAGMRAKCIRCGTTIFVPGGPDDDDDRSIDDLAAERLSDAGPRSKTDRSPWVEGDDLEGPQHGQYEEGDPDYGNPTAETPLPPPRDTKPLKIAAAVVALVLLGAAGYFGFAHEPTPPPKKVAPVLADDEPATPAASEGPGVSEFVGPPEPPPLPPAPPILLNAEQLNEELARDPQAANARYSGRLLEVRGECEVFAGGRLRFRSNSGEARVAVTLPQYVPRFRNDDGQTLDLSTAPAVFGGWFTYLAVPPTAVPLAGRPVTARGTYRGDGVLTEAFVLSLVAPADALYLGKTLTVFGKVAAAEDEPNGVTRVTLARRSTGAAVEVACLLTKSASVGLRVRLGDTLTVTGKCGGRTNSVVVLDNCALAAVGGTQLGADKLAADYEADLQRFPAIDPDATAAPATAEQLAEAYTADPAAANARFANRLLEVTGTITQADPKACTLQLEVPTDATLQVRLQFEPADFVAVPSGERRLTFKAVCRGAVRGQKLLTLTECRYYDADAADATAQRLTAEYFPIRAGRQWDVIRVTYGAPPPPPRAARPRPAYTVTPDAPPVAAKAKPSPAQRLQYRLKPEGLLLVGQLQLGTFAGASLFDGAAPPVKWVGKPVKPDVAPAKCVEAFRLRASPLMVEQGFAKPPADPDAPVTPPDPKDQGMTWHPVIPLNARAGRSRVANLAPGVVLTTTVESFFRDAEGREAVKVVSVLTDERSKDVRQETVVTYAKNVGEVSRVVTLRDATRSRVLSEQRLDGEPSETTLTGAAAPKK